MDEILNTEYENTVGYFQTLKYKPSNTQPECLMPTAVYGCLTRYRNDTDRIALELFLKVPDHHKLFKEALFSFLKPCLLPGENMRCLLNVRYQSLNIYAKCAPVTIHPEMSNTELAKRVLYLINKAKELTATKP